MVLVVAAAVFGFSGISLLSDRLSFVESLAKTFLADYEVPLNLCLSAGFSREPLVALSTDCTCCSLTVIVLVIGLSSLAVNFETAVA